MHPTYFYAIEIVINNNITLNLTNAGDNLHIGGLEFKAGSAFTISAIQWREDEIPASFQLNIPRSVAPNLEMLDFLKAKIKLWRNSVVKGHKSFEVLFTGEVVGASTDQALITLEVKGRKLELAKPIVPQISNSCRAEFGSTRCGINLADLLHQTYLEQINPPFELVLNSVNNMHQYKLGTLSFPSLGKKFTIIGQVGVRMIVDNHLPVNLQTKEFVELTPGCNKLFATCVKAYQNAINFDGEPDEFNTT